MKPLINNSGNSCEEANINSQLSLENLPTDILLAIFAKCDPESWAILAKVCVRFHTVLGPDSWLWEQFARKLVIVNGSSNFFKSRMYDRISAQERYHVYKNWRKGLCALKPIINISKRHLLPWLILESDKIWVGVGSDIKAFSRSPPAIFTLQPFKKRNNFQELLALSSNNGDVGRFTVKDGNLVTGTTNGSLLMWNAATGKLLCKKIHGHSSEISTVKMDRGIIVSGSRDNTVKIWQHRKRSLFSIQTITLGDRVLSMDIDPTGTSLCTGTTGYHDIPPSRIHDLSTGNLICVLRSQFRVGEGVYDVHFENPYEVLTADFNATLRLWDLRTQTNVLVWEDPHDSAINCIASDNNFTFFTGTATHGGIRLWDKRSSRCNRLFFARPDLRSPVYSLDFDMCELFVALDRSVMGFDFSGENQKPNNLLTVYRYN